MRPRRNTGHQLAFVDNGTATLEAQVRKSIFADLHNSVATYQNFHRERELTLTHLAELLADLPNLRALMTTQDEATIQDASSFAARASLPPFSG